MDISASLSFSSSDESNIQEMPPIIFNSNAATVASGKLQFLVELLLPTDDHSFSDDCIYSFLLNIRIFCDLSEILHDLLKVFIFKQNSKTENFRKESRRKHAMNVIHLMSLWCNEFACDFFSDIMKKRLIKLLDTCCSIDRSLITHRNSLFENLHKKLDQMNRMSEKELNQVQIMISPTNSNQHQRPSLNILDSWITPKLMATQLTLIEQAKMKIINSEEFVYLFLVNNEFRNGASLPKNSFAGRIAMAQNIHSYILWCNRLSYLVASEICMKSRLKTRVRTLEFFIEVAKECFNTGNFNSCVAIISALNMPAVRRLQKMWAKIDSSRLKAIEQALSPKKNFSAYRSTLQAATWHSMKGKPSMQAIIPAFSVVCRDLYALHAFCSELLVNDHLNFNAFREFSRIVKAFTQWKQSKCTLEKHMDLHKYILTSPVMDDKDLELSSYECESPEGSQEKISYKKLRCNFSQLTSNVAL